MKAYVRLCSLSVSIMDTIKWVAVTPITSKFHSQVLQYALLWYLVTAIAFERLKILTEGQEWATEL